MTVERFALVVVLAALVVVGVTIVVAIGWFV